MSSGGLAVYFPASEGVPRDYLCTLSKVVYAAGCFNFFLFAFICLHAHTYFREEGWKKDNWFFRTIVSNLVILSLCSVALSSAAAHWVLESLYTGKFAADALNWIDVVQRLLCFPVGTLANSFFTWRVFQVSDSKAVWISCLLLWIPAGGGFILAEVFHILTLSDIKYGRAWRISELVGTCAIFSLDIAYLCALSYRLWLCRRRQAKPDVDPVSQYFIGTLQVSLFTSAVTIGNLVTVAFLGSARVYIYYSFFLLVLPNCWSLAVVWAINQRVTIRKKMKSASDDMSLAQRLEVVGWRNHNLAIERRKGDEQMDCSDRGDPSTWRGDDETEDHSSYRRTWRKHKLVEPDYSSVELDTSPLDALETTGKIAETRVSGIWVKTETKIETSLA